MWTQTMMLGTTASGRVSLGLPTRSISRVVQASGDTFVRLTFTCDEGKLVAMTTLLQFVPTCFAMCRCIWSSPRTETGTGHKTCPCWCIFVQVVRC